MAAERRFAWKGTDRHGKAVDGIVRATDAATASLALRRQGILATRVRAARAAPGKAITRHDIALFTRQLSTMMAAGVPLLRVRHRRQGTCQARHYRADGRLAARYRSRQQPAAGISPVSPPVRRPVFATWWRPASRPASCRNCWLAWPRTRKKPSPCGGRCAAR